MTFFLAKTFFLEKIFCVEIVQNIGTIGIRIFTVYYLTHLNDLITVVSTSLTVHARVHFSYLCISFPIC